MNNAEKFKQIFGLYATELWSMPESDFLEWLNRDVETTQIDHTADIGKKVSIPCGQENDVIFRQAAIDALARMMPRSYTPDGSHPADEEIFRAQEVFADCIEALEILPSAQPEPCVNTIDALNESIKHFDDMAEECRRNANIERNDYMDMRDDAYEAQQLAQWLNELKYLREKIEQITIKTEPKWIPVSERMPELDEDGYSEKVLVCFDRVSFCEICEYRTDKWYIGDMEDSPEDIGLRVTAWKPLPEPYRGGEE